MAFFSLKRAPETKLPLNLGGNKTKTAMCPDSLVGHGEIQNRFETPVSRRHFDGRSAWVVYYASKFLCLVDPLKNPQQCTAGLPSGKLT